MGSLGSTLRSVRERALGALIRQVAADTAERSVAEINARISETQRIIADQGDAADEVAETIGRTLTRLSAEVTALASEVERLNQRLERFEQLDGAQLRT